MGVRPYRCNTCCHDCCSCQPVVDFAGFYNGAKPTSVFTPCAVLDTAEFWDTVGRENGGCVWRHPRTIFSGSDKPKLKRLSSGFWELTIYSANSGALVLRPSGDGLSEDILDKCSDDDANAQFETFTHHSDNWATAGKPCPDATATAITARVRMHGAPCDLFCKHCQEGVAAGWRVTFTEAPAYFNDTWDIFHLSQSCSFRQCRFAIVNQTSGQRCVAMSVAKGGQSTLLTAYTLGGSPVIRETLYGRWINHDFSCLNQNRFTWHDPDNELGAPWNNPVIVTPLS